MQEKIDEIKATIKATIKFQVKNKAMCLNVAVGNVELAEKEILVDTQLAANVLVSLLKKQWQHIGQIYVKTSMGPSFKVYY